jgi:membrane-bound lytic murein transglycosylase B
MSTSPMKNEPTYTLELRAADQRRRLHSSVNELRFKVQQRLDVKRIAREYLVPASGVGAAIGLLLGYGLTGMFTRN